jgi:hypothetical protein
MAMVFGDLYVALLDAGADEEKARRAAEEVCQAQRLHRFSEMPGRLRVPGVSNLVLPYMLGIATGLTVALVLVPFR